MLDYNKNNKRKSQYLRKNLTDAESLLWSKLRRKQLCNVQFYRQKPILNYIVDFYAPSVKIVIEVDGSQHYEDKFIEKDNIRDENLSNLNLKILRFSNLEVLTELESVMLTIYDEICFYKNPP